MIDQIIAMFQNYTFQVVALGAVTLGILNGITGTFAVLRKQSLLGDSIAHASLAGISMAYILTQTKNTEVLLLGALISGLLAIWIINGITGHTRINFESAMALIMSVFFGVGLILLTHIQKQPDSQQAGLERFLFGQAATILERDVWLVAGVLGLVIILMFIFWKEIKLFTFDPIYAHSIEMPIRFIQFLLSGFTVAAIIMGIQMVGVVLMSALIIAPAVASRQWTNSLFLMTVLAGLIGAVSGLGGALTSALVDKFPTGPAIVVIASTIVVFSLLFAPHRGIISKLMRRHQSKQNFEADMAVLNLLTHHHLSVEDSFTKEDLKEVCIIGHHQEGRAFERLFNNLLQRNRVVLSGDNQYILTDTARIEYQQNRGDTQ